MIRIGCVPRFLPQPYTYHSAINNLLRCCISSIPRWSYSQQLDFNPEDEPPNEDCLDFDEKFEFATLPIKARGIGRAQKALLNESRRIFRGKNELVEHLLRKDDPTGLIRLQSWKSICASAVYLAHKNLPYTSGI